MSEEWESDPEVIAARAAYMHAEDTAAQSENDLSDVMSDLARYEADMQRLLNMQAAARKKNMELRRKQKEAERERERQQSIINDAKVRYERQREAEINQAIITKEVENFAWYKGVYAPNGDFLKIREHQMEAAQFIAANQRVILGDEMGVGKSLSLLATLDVAKVKRALFVAPVAVCSNLVNENKLWSPHRNVVNIYGLSKKQRAETIEMLKTMSTFGIPILLVVNYEAWRRDESLIDSLLQMQFEAVVFDEAHVLKDTKSNAYRGVKRITLQENTCKMCGKYSSPASWGVKCDCGAQSTTQSARIVVPMTGTMILNKPQDMFALLSLIEPDTFYDLHQFLGNYARQDYDGKWEFQEGGIPSLMKRLSGRILRRTTKDAKIPLTDAIVKTYEVVVDDDRYPLQRKVMDSLQKNAAYVLNRIDPRTGQPAAIKAMEMIALITRNRQAATYPAGIQMKDEDGKIILSVGEEVQESAKIDQALDIIQEVTDDRQRVVVFSQFKGALAHMEQRLKEMNISAVRYDGDTSRDVAEAVKTNFDEKMGETAKWDVLLLNYKTGGVGLNLTAAEHVIMLDKEWNAGKEDQAIKRVLRPGQTKQVYIHDIKVVDSIDYWMQDLVDNKRALAEGVNAEQRNVQDALLAKLAGK